MIKELKYVFYFFVIFFFFFFTLKYYFSDDNKKNSYRSIQLLDRKIDKYTSDLMAFRVGPVRLRQQRRRPISCNRKGPFQKEEKSPCDQTFSEGNYHAGSWYKPMKNNSINLGKDIWELAYIYRTAIDLRGVSYSGIYETYTGAGYAAELGVNLS